MKENTDLNCFNEIITQALDKIKKEEGASFSLDSVNLAEMQRMTGISRARLHRLKGKRLVHWLFSPDSNNVYVKITYAPLVQDTGGVFYVTVNASQYHPGSERLVKRCKKM